ncbi:splicing factor-like protein 1 [Aristolochia californica]|uniref:splicing factor-like protein 1 n=1 Tax=Aristolochia californica TaxID=171875 RepID=UPI0035D8C734
MNISDTQFGGQIENFIGGLKVPLESREECFEDSILLPESDVKQSEDVCAGLKLDEKEVEDSSIRMHLSEEDNWFLTLGTESGKEHHVDLIVGSELNEECIYWRTSDSMRDKSKHQPGFVKMKTSAAFSAESEQAQANYKINKFSDLQSDCELSIIETQDKCCLFNITATDANTPQRPGQTGSSGKRRRAMLQTLLKEGEEATDGDEMCKRRRTRWSGDDSELKMLGPIKLPDFVKDVDNCVKVDPEVQVLNIKLVEVNKKLQGSNPPDEERSLSSPPLYDDLGKRMKSRKMRYHNQLVEKRREIILRLVRKNPTFRPSPAVKPSNFQRKLYIPVKEYPGYNFIGPIIGPCGRTQKRMERQTGAHIVIRGKGLVKGCKVQKHDTKHGSKDKDDLHVLIEADNEESLDAAVKLVEKLLVPVEGLNVSSVLDPWSGGSALIASSPPSGVYLGELSGSRTSSYYGSNFLFGTDPSKATKTKLSDIMHEVSIMVCHLPLSMDDEGLMEMFFPFGKVVSARVVRDPTTRLSKCYGFVKFTDHFSAGRAAQCMHGQKMDGKMLAVQVVGSPNPSFLPGCTGILSTVDQGFRQSTGPTPLRFMLPRSSSEIQPLLYSSSYTYTYPPKYDSWSGAESSQDPLLKPQPQVSDGASRKDENAGEI